MATTASLGHSLELRDGDLAVEGGRLAVVAGLPNLVQALTLRVLTPLGDDRFATTYGLDTTDVFAQAVSTRNAQDLLRLSLVRTLGSDSRVREIRDIAVAEPPDTGRRVWQIDVTVITVDDTQHTIALSVSV